MNNNYGNLSSTEFNHWLNKVSEYENENCVESISESSEENDSSNCFIKKTQLNNNDLECMVEPLTTSECKNKKYKANVIKVCSCLKTNTVPLDSEYFNSIIPPISLLYKDKNKVQMIQNKNIRNIQSVNMRKLRTKRRHK